MAARCFAALFACSNTGQEKQRSGFLEWPLHYGLVSFECVSLCAATIVHDERKKKEDQGNVYV